MKKCKKFTEEAKISIRGNRKEAMDALKAGEKSKIFTEDDRKAGEDLIQKATDEFVKKVDEILVLKEKELMDD